MIGLHHHIKKKVDIQVVTKEERVRKRFAVLDKIRWQLKLLLFLLFKLFLLYTNIWVRQIILYTIKVHLVPFSITPRFH